MGNKQGRQGLSQNGGSAFGNEPSQIKAYGGSSDLFKVGKKNGKDRNPREKSFLSQCMKDPELMHQGKVDSFLSDCMIAYRRDELELLHEKLRYKD